jgi:hypothetical protein
MTYNAYNDQLHSQSGVLVLASFPVQTTLIRARLRVSFCYFAIGPASPQLGVAPPNLYNAIWWAPPGTTIPIIDASNKNSSVWYASKLGCPYQVSAEVDMYSSTDWAITRNEQYDLDKDDPNFQAVIYEIGISYNWLGAGFFGIDPWFTYYLECWTY